MPQLFNGKPSDHKYRTETPEYSAKNVARWATTDEIAVLADMQIDLRCQKQKNQPE